MTQTIRDVMTPFPVTLPFTASVLDAAQKMLDHDIGEIVVVQDERLFGMVTDRDLVVRALAKNLDPVRTHIYEVCSSHGVAALGPEDSIEDAIRLMRERAVRRLPIIAEGRPVGVVSIGDLAVERDRDSVLADISSAPPSR